MDDRRPLSKPLRREGRGADEQMRRERDAASRSSRPVSRAFGWWMIAFLVAGVLLSLLNPALREDPGGSLVDGSWTANYQQQLDENSPLLDFATGVWGAIEYVLLREGRPGVLVGADGWLFPTQEFDAPPDRAEFRNRLATNLAHVTGVREELAGDGVDLLVLLVPSKARLYEEKLGRYSVPQTVRESYDLALGGLEESGVAVLDARPALEAAKATGEAFFRTDTHWTPHATALVAQAVAQRLGGPSWSGTHEYRTETVGTSDFHGDLSSFIPMGPLYDVLGPPADTLRELQTSRAGGPGSDLFAEEVLPVTLVGTSYSADERWHFAGALRRELGSDVLVAAQEGRGPLEPMSEYLNGEAYRDSRPELVLWEIPERHLSADWANFEGE